MKTLYRFGLFFLTVSISTFVLAQQPTQQQATKIVSVSAKTTTARIADPDELVNVNGKVMRVADVVAILSSSTLLVQHPHTPEKQNSSDAPHIQPESKKHSSSLVAAPESVEQPAAAEPQKHLSD
jgi:hypothetical protein